MKAVVCNGSWIVPHELSVDEVPETYKRFGVRERGWTKVVP